MPDLAPPAQAAIRGFLAEVEAYLRDRLVDAGRADADMLARELQTLLAGGITLSVAVGNTGPARAAREAADAVLRRAPATPR
jgi:hypothetical protein